MSSSVEISPELVQERVARLNAEIEKKQAEVSALIAELEWWEKGRRFFGFDDEPDDDEPEARQSQQPLLANGKPPLRRAILRVMSTRPNRTWPAEVVIAELERHGWLPNGKNAEHTTRSMLANMHKRGQVRRMARGKYRLVPTGSDP